MRCMWDYTTNKGHRQEKSVSDAANRLTSVVGVSYTRITATTISFQSISSRSTCGGSCLIHMGLWFTRMAELSSGGVRLARVL